MRASQQLCSTRPACRTAWVQLCHTMMSVREVHTRGGATQPTLRLRHHSVHAV